MLAVTNEVIGSRTGPQSVSLNVDVVAIIDSLASLCAMEHMRGRLAVTLPRPSAVEGRGMKTCLYRDPRPANTGLLRSKVESRCGRRHDEVEGARVRRTSAASLNSVGQKAEPVMQ